MKPHFKKTLIRHAEARNDFLCAAQNLAMIESLTVGLQMTVTVTSENQPKLNQWSTSQEKALKAR